MRHLRLRQVLTAQGFTGKELREAVAFEHRNWKEDGESLPTIGQVRKMHETLGTWDKSTRWVTYFYLGSDDIFNVIYLNGVTPIYPKANYNPIKKISSMFINGMEVAKCMNTGKELHGLQWKEQEQCTLEFFEREGC